MPGAYAVEIETHPIGNFTLPLQTAVDRVGRALSANPGLVDLDVAGNAEERTLLVSAGIHADSAEAAVGYLMRLIGAAAAAADAGTVTARRLSAQPERVIPEQLHTHRTPVPAHSWPPMFTSRRVAAPPSRATDMARIWASAHALARELRQNQAVDSAQAIEHCLRPGRSTADGCRALQHELSALLSVPEMDFIPGFVARAQALHAEVRRVLAGEASPRR